MLNVNQLDFIADMVTEEYTKSKIEASEWKKLVKRSLPHERRVIVALRSYFLKQEKNVLLLMTKYRKAVSFPFLPEKFISGQSDELSKVIFPMIKRIVESEGSIGMDALQARVNTLLDSFVLDDDVLDSIQSMVREAATSITETTFKKLLNAYDTGSDLGETLAEIKLRMSDVFQDAVKNRVNTIARTEVIRASNHSRIYAYEQSGVVDKIRWYTAIDERRCEACAALHNHVVKLGREFKSGVTYPPLHPRCRCTVLPEVSAKYAIKWLDIYKSLVQKGGPNSGNYGHGGRPGKVGGSSTGSRRRREPKLSTDSTMYHGTQQAVITNILKYGILPQKEHNHSENYYNGERKDSVYVSSKESNAEYYAKWAFEKNQGRASGAVIFKVYIPKGEKFKYDSNAEDAFLFKRIKPEWIKGYTMYTPKRRSYGFYSMDDLKKGDFIVVKEMKEVVYYVPTLFLKPKSKQIKLRPKRMDSILVVKIGTSASGNRGHAGRPGKVGGSKLNKAKLQDKARNSIYAFSKNQEGNIEQAVVIIGAKTVILKGDPMGNSVYIPYAILDKAKYMVHNHPGNASFSS